MGSPAGCVWVPSSCWVIECWCCPEIADMGYVGTCHCWASKSHWVGRGGPAVMKGGPPHTHTWSGRVSVSVGSTFSRAIRTEKVIVYRVIIFAPASSTNAGSIFSFVFYKLSHVPSSLSPWHNLDEKISNWKHWNAAGCIVDNFHFIIIIMSSVIVWERYNWVFYVIPCKIVQ